MPDTITQPFVVYSLTELQGATGLTGPQGQRGSVYKGHFTTSGALPTVDSINVIAGDFATVGSTFEIWRVVGNSWSDAGVHLQGPTGIGDMQKSTYDTNNNGIVDSCDSLPYSRLTSVPSTFAPSAHKTSHQSGGSDAIALDTLAATTDITTLNTSSSKHGLCPKLSGSGSTYLDGTGAFTNPSTSALPTGAIIPYAGSPVSGAPSGWLMCDGSAVSRITYAGIYAVCGTIYGVGDGSSTFNLPDLRSRFPLGSSSYSGTWSSSGSLTTRQPGQTGGEETHVLVTAELASHSHTITDPGHNHGISDPSHSHSVSDPTHAHSTVAHSHGVNDPTHSHTYVYPLGNFAATSGGSQFSPAGTASTGGSATGISIQSAAPNTNGAYTGVSIVAATTGVTVQSHSTGITATNNTGSGTGHNNMPPWLCLQFIIKT
jgi:microcystin-dependent protein